MAYYMIKVIVICIYYYKCQNWSFCSKHQFSTFNGFLWYSIPL